MSYTARWLGVRGAPAADGQLREDDPWWVRRGYGLIIRAARSPAALDGVTGERRSPAWLDGVNTGLLRVMAYNMLAIARAVHLRRDELISWKQLRDWMRFGARLLGARSRRGRPGEHSARLNQRSLPASLCPNQLRACQLPT